MYKQVYPDSPVSYRSYLQIFNTKYNIAFGYPRSDTCSTCDSTKIELQAIENNFVLSDGFKTKRLQEIKMASELHQRRAKEFYTRKRAARLRSKTDEKFHAITLDFSKKPMCPKHHN